MGEEEKTCMLRLEEVAQNPLPGCVIPACVSFSPDDRLISYLLSPDSSLYRKLYAFYPSSGKHELLVNPPAGGGVEESNLSSAEKFRRERLRERGLGITRYEWAKAPPQQQQQHRLMVPLPAGIYVQDVPGSELLLRLESASTSPILEPQLSPDGCMIAYVRDDEIYVLPVTYGEPKQISFGARGNGKRKTLYIEA